MNNVLLGRSNETDHNQPVTVVLEHQDGKLEILDDCELKVGVILHEKTRQAFPEPVPIAQYALSLDNDFAELDSYVNYFDDELPAPVEAPEFVFGAAVAACEAAERGELGEPEEVKVNGRLQVIAAAGGVIFLLAMGIGGLTARGGSLTGLGLGGA